MRPTRTTELLYSARRDGESRTHVLNPYEGLALPLCDTTLPLDFFAPGPMRQAYCFHRGPERRTVVPQVGLEPTSTAIKSRMHSQLCDRGKKEGWCFGAVVSQPLGVLTARPL